MVEVPVKKQQLENAINELSSLFKMGESRESKYQEFFENNPIVFEVLGYIKAHPKPKLQIPDGDYLEPDFLVEQVDGLYQIFELKTPQEKLVQEIKSREKFYAEVDKYISQVFTYSDYFDDSEHRKLVNKTLSLDVQKKPDIVLVIGMDKNVDKKLLHLLTRQRANPLHIVTYDDILSRLQFHHAAMFGYSENLSGVSWHGIVTLHEVDVKRRQYIFDAGNSVYHSRWSLYLNEQKHLCFEILDRDGVSHSISIPVGKASGIYWEAQSYICCEFGSSDRFSIMQLLIDNRLIAKNEFSHPISIPVGLDFRRNTIASDITGQNHGTLTMAGLAIYNIVLSFQQRYGLAEGIFDEFFTPPSLVELLSGQTRSKHIPNTNACLVIGAMGELEE
jgi:hypothetical protein